jgi:hypothetical protein
VILEKAVEVDRVRLKAQMGKIRHDFLGKDFPYLPPLMNHRIETVR